MLAFLEELGDMTAAQILDEVAGEGSYDKLAEYAEGLADMKVKDFADDLFTITENTGLSTEDIFGIASAVIAKLTYTEIDLNELIEGYSEMSVARAVAEYMTETGNEVTEKEVRNGILNDIEQIEKYCGMKISVFLTEENAPFMPVDYDEILEMIEQYGKSATISLTFDEDDNFTDFAVSYLMSADDGTEMALIKLVWTDGQKAPEIKINVDGIMAALEKGEDDITLTASVMGYDCTAVISQTEDGAMITLSVMDGKTEAGNATITVSTAGNKPSITVSGSINGQLVGYMGGSMANADDDDVPEDVIIGGSITVGDEGATFDDEIYDEVDDLSSAFYHINTVLISSNGSGVVKIEYKSDETGEYYIITYTDYATVVNSRFVQNGTTYYYGTVLASSYKMRVASIDGIPAIDIIAGADCGDWIKLMINVAGMAEGSYTIYNMCTFTTHYSDVNIVSEGEVSAKDMGTEMFVFSAQIYYNTSNGLTADKSQHDYEINAYLDEGSESCDDGIIIKKTCTICGIENSTRNRGHYITEQITQLPTSCPDPLSVTISECAACGDQFLNINHTELISGTRMEIVTAERYQQIYDEEYNYSYKINYDNYIAQGMSEDEAALKADQAATQSAENMTSVLILNTDLDLPEIEYVYSGTKTICYCTRCGLTVEAYTYNTNATGKPEDCKQYTYITATYPGDAQGNAAFEQSFYAVSINSHIYEKEHKDVTAQEFDETVAFVESYAGELPFTPELASISQDVCKECGQPLNITITLTASSSALTMSIMYDDSGKMYGYAINYNCFNENDTARQLVEQFKEIAGEIPSFDSSEIHVQKEYEPDGLEFYSMTEVDLLTDEENVFSIYVSTDKYNGNATVSKKNSDCEYRYEYYNYNTEDGQWKLTKSSSSFSHKYITREYPSDNCKEEGRWSSYVCSVCGEASGTSALVGYTHSMCFDKTGEEALESLAGTPEISGLTASVSAYVCSVCGVAINSNITLEADWVLSQDVVLSADELSLNLNGYKIDLNGHTLALYGSGSGTASIADIGEAESAGICDSAEEKGLLVMFANGGLIEIGYGIETDCTLIMSDKDDLSTIYDTLLAQRHTVPALSYDTAARDDIAEAMNCEGAKWYDGAHFGAFTATGDGIKAYDGEDEAYIVTAKILLEQDEIFTFDIVTAGYGSYSIYVDGYLKEQYSKSNMTFRYSASSSMVHTITIVYYADDENEDEGIMLSNAAVISAQV